VILDYVFWFPGTDTSVSSNCYCVKFLLSLTDTISLFVGLSQHPCVSDKAVFLVCVTGLGFVTTFVFIFLVGVFVSSWIGASMLLTGEWFIKRMPLVKHIYSASKQISAAISPDQNTQAFKEVAIIRHPRVGEYAFGFITSTLILQVMICFLL
jgi:uncharacterized membrane protein